MIKLVIGTRAELIKVIPVILELRNKVEFEILATGQHDINYILESYKIDIEPIYINNPSKGFLLSTKKAFNFFKKTILKLKRNIDKEDLVIVHGDTLSTLAGAFAGKIKRSKVFHIEAGLRSWDPFEPFPEEIVRNIVDMLSDVLFAPSKLSFKNIKRQFPWKKGVYLTGNTIIDAALISYKIKKKVDVPKEEFGIVSIHRHENLTKKYRLIKIVKILLETSKYIKLYFFAYENTILALKKYNLLKYLENNENIVFQKPLDYISFIKWLANSKILLTDGGSIQEESLIFKVPAIILRKKTERVEGLWTGLNYLSKLKIKPTIEKVKQFLNGDYKTDFKNPYGKPGVSKRIVRIIGGYTD